MYIDHDRSVEMARERAHITPVMLLIFLGGHYHPLPQSLSTTEDIPAPHASHIKTPVVGLPDYRC